MGKLIIRWTIIINWYHLYCFIFPGQHHLRYYLYLMHVATMIIISVLYGVCGGCGQRCHAIACSLCSCTAGYFNPFNSEFLASNPPQSRYNFFCLNLTFERNFFSLRVWVLLLMQTLVSWLLLYFYSLQNNTPYTAHIALTCYMLSMQLYLFMYVSLFCACRNGFSSLASLLSVNCSSIGRDWQLETKWE